MKNLKLYNKEILTFIGNFSTQKITLVCMYLVKPEKNPGANNHSGKEIIMPAKNHAIDEKQNRSGWCVNILEFEKNNLKNYWPYNNNTAEIAQNSWHSY